MISPSTLVAHARNRPTVASITAPRLNVGMITLSFGADPMAGATTLSVLRTEVRVLGRLGGTTPIGWEQAFRRLAPRLRAWFLSVGKKREYLEAETMATRPDFEPMPNRPELVRYSFCNDVVIYHQLNRQPLCPR